MIGQKNLINRLEVMMSHARFIILVGDTGSGRKTLIDECIYENLKDTHTKWELSDSSVDSVREMRTDAYSSTHRLYVMPDTDGMSPAAKNALLKIVEDCPNNHIYVMTLQDINNMPDTIRSRAMVFYMDKYSIAELIEYYDSKYDDESVRSYIKDLCDNPEDIDRLVNIDVDALYSFVQKTINNIVSAPLYNVYKVANSIAIKESDEEKYDLVFFWRCVIKCCSEAMLMALSDKDYDTALYNASLEKVTSQCLGKLGMKSVNKTMLFDKWIHNVRNSCREYIGEDR